MIGWLVGQCHVGQTNMEVIRYIFSKMRKKGRKKFFAMPRKERRKVMEKIVSEHKANREVYGYVMGGMHSKKG